MKPKIILICSLAANAALALGIVYLAQNPAPGSGKLAEAPDLHAFSQSDTQPVATAEVRFLETAGAPAKAPFDWTRVESSDYRQYIANLRAIGCPEETIRDIIVADVNKLFASKAAAERTGTNGFQYWKGGNPLGDLFNEETIAKQQEVAKEKRDLLKTLLGSDVPMQPGMTADAGQQIYERMLDFIPSEKQSELIELEQKFAAKMMGSLKKSSQGDLSAMRALMAEKDEELLKILSPEEKFQYDLRMSQTAMLMRMQMGDMELSEREFQEIFKLRKGIDDQFGIEGMGALNQADVQARDTARKQANEQVKNLLGDRYAEYSYEMGGDWAAQTLKRIANQHEIPRETALQAFSMVDLARAEADAIRADTARSEQAKQAAFQAIYDETSRSVSGVLGEKAANDYLKKIALIPNFNPAKR